MLLWYVLDPRTTAAQCYSIPYNWGDIITTKYHSDTVSRAAEGECVRISTMCGGCAVARWHGGAMVLIWTLVHVPPWPPSRSLAQFLHMDPKHLRGFVVV